MSSPGEMAVLAALKAGPKHIGMIRSFTQLKTTTTASCVGRLLERNAIIRIGSAFDAGLTDTRADAAVYALPGTAMLERKQPDPKPGPLERALSVIEQRVFDYLCAHGPTSWPNIARALDAAPEETKHACHALERLRKITVSGTEIHGGIKGGHPRRLFSVRRNDDTDFDDADDAPSRKKKGGGSGCIAAPITIGRGYRWPVGRMR